CSQAAFSAFSLSKARSDVRQSFYCFHFVPEFFYFEPNLYCTHFLALFECLLLFHITFNQQILDICNPSLFFRCQAMVFFHLNPLRSSSISADLEFHLGNIGEVSKVPFAA